MTTPHGVDAYLGAVQPLWAAGVRAKVVAVSKPAAADAITLTLRANRRWQGFKAGQFIAISVEVQGVRHTRCFSISSSESASRTFDISVKAHGAVSSKLQQAKVGDVFEVSVAQGEFVLPSPRPASVALISAGSGITPVFSMLQTLLNEGYTGDIHFLHYARDTAWFADALHALALKHFNLKLWLLNPAADGHFDPSTVKRLSLAGHATYVCGPAGLIQAVQASLPEAHAEYFQPPALPVTEGEAGTVQFKHLKLVSDGRSLLEQAESAGLQPLSGCRMGICHTCVCPKTSGSTRNLLTGEVSSQPESIRLCISVPVGDVSIDL